MKNYFFVLILGMTLVLPSASAEQHNTPLPQSYLKDSFPVLVEKSRDLLAHAYMAGELLQTTDTLAGWKGFPVKLYAYKTGKDIHTGQQKNGLVFMLNPSPEKLATWIATTCWLVKGSVAYRYTDELFEWIKHQSGAQFPVKGIVYEDQYVKGYYEPYLFKDGVTVYVKDSSWWPADKTCTKEQLQYYLRITDQQLKPATGQYARIASTTREDYKSASGQAAVGDKDDRRLAWLKVVRELYKKAWNSDQNELLIMWARAHLK